MKVLNDFNDFLNSKEYEECEDKTNALTLLTAYHKWLEKELVKIFSAQI